MAQPSVVVTAQPVESGAIVYGPLAARSASDDPNGQLAVLFNMTNQEAASVTFTSVVVSFPDSDSVAEVTNTPAPAVAIGPAKTAQWYFLIADMIYLAEPAPATVRFQLYFDPFPDPVTVDMSLAPYEGTSYPFPARAADLAEGEYWYGCSGIHGGAGGGTQMFAYDLRVVGLDSATNQWSVRFSGTDGTQNADYRAWGKPIYAMAAGTVVQFLDGMAANTPPKLPKPTPNTVEGNHFYIQHGDDLALYAHFQSGTMNAALMTNGAAVAAGDLLGLCGNSGNSSEPHLHVQIIRATQPWSGVGRPLMFTGTHSLDLGLVNAAVWPPTSESSWSSVDGRALPNVWSAIWPGKIKLVLSKRRWTYVLAWAWLIVIGGLMFTPGGIDCIKCGPLLESILGLVSIGAGVAGMAAELFRKPSAKVAGFAPALAMRKELDGVEERAG
jgi:murein DD-endopeptidase MepM/ murein hydrolase activator NlpD